MNPIPTKEQFLAMTPEERKAAVQSRLELHKKTHTQQKRLNATNLQKRTLRSKFSISAENVKLRQTISSLPVEEATKLKLKVAMAHLKQQKDAGHIAPDGQKKPSFIPHQLAEINSILYNVPYTTPSTKPQTM